MTDSDNRGGARQGAGRPSSWKSGCKFEETKLIRVPARIADQVLEYAHKLDAGESFELVTKLQSRPRYLVTNSNKTVTNSNDELLIGSKIVCPKCESPRLNKDGFRQGEQRYACRNCRHKFLEHLAKRVQI